jgi:hypothetical protein
MKTTDEQLDSAKVAIRAVLMRIQRDPRVAYYFDPMTDCMEKLTRAHADLHGRDVDAVRAEYYPTLSFERPAA